jgi:acetoacetyl-CoA synthetase
MNEIPRWFIGARLNYAENLLRFNDNRIAIYSCSKLIIKNFIIQNI